MSKESAAVWYLKEENKKKHTKDCLTRYYDDPSKYQKMMANYRKRLRVEGRCTSCSVNLIEGEKLTCVNCGRTIKEKMKYAKDNIRHTL